MIVLHIALKSEWNDESLKGSYGVSYISKNRFIPCYYFSDISSIKLNLPTLKEYVILCIDLDKISSEVKYEKSKDLNMIMPNIYGKINKEAVICTLPYTFDIEDNFVVTNELLDFNIINEALEKLEIKYESHKYFNDGTQSRIILLNDSYIIKEADPKILKAEVDFATFYKNIPMLQKIAYFDAEYKYVVYTYIPGDVMHTVEDFHDLADNIKSIVSHYKVYPQDDFGYLGETVISWGDFLRNEVEKSSLDFPEIDYLLPTVNAAIDELEKISFDKKLIHGDFGTHNFIKQNEKFIAAIDPIPLLGDPTYDLLFALVINIDLIPYLSINFLTEYTGETKQKVVALLKVVLYIRICRCAKYNKDWIEPYMDFGNNLFK